MIHSPPTSGGGDPLRVLIVAYHFPPLQGSSGILRTLKFVKYLRQFGVTPTVLTAATRAYPKIDNALLAQVPSDVEVVRAFALDTQHHLSIGGKYPALLSLPDRYATWIPFGILSGLRVIKRLRIQAIFSTYPVASAHVIGLNLARKTGLPWIADFRDPMWDEFSTGDSKMILKSRKSVEANVVRHCRHAVLNTPGMHRTFLRRYPETDPSSFSVIPNGFDEADFQDLKPAQRFQGAPITLIHAGLLERADRDPGPFMKAVRLLLDRGEIAPENFQVQMVASVHDAEYQKEVAGLGLASIIHFLPPVPYGKGLQMMSEADILLLFQGPSCNEQVPAKLYEYMRIGKPIFAVTTPEGETGRLVANSGAGEVVSHDRPEAIADALTRWIRNIRQGGSPPKASPKMAMGFSRLHQARTLAGLLDVASRPT